jgi:hypothetical protein
VATFSPPIASKVTPRFDLDAAARPVPTTPLQRALFKYFRPLDQGVDTYVMSDGTVTTSIPVELSDGSFSVAAIPNPMLATAGPLLGPPEGAEGGPYGTPPPYASVFDATSGQLIITEFQQGQPNQPPYLKYFFAGGHGPYAGISANLVAILTAAKFDNFLS